MLRNFRTYLANQWGLPKEAIDQLCAQINTKQVDKEGFLLKSGEICPLTFFVEKGLLRMYALNEKGKEDILQFAPENWLVSDRGSVYFNEPSDYYIDAIENTTVVLLDQGFMERISDLGPSFRKLNERLLHNHIRHLNKRVKLLLGASAETRYLNFIKLHPDVLLRVPQWMVASYLGIAPESLSRVRRALAKKNFKPGQRLS
ncbi:Crp/Fnr family transcriptional regulator [Pseudozobellia thermophila]|uniref:cAMP-binding domain of CRP or a regulatory subunit of cAMP-dependent protein kinases n=1 Tax=Pseudozobellia thermophila TaxID=192903 RepID=A0A1M6JLL4_9FLAO|nr:Crp/Fnr family transcriptional regulator [Pseudozobellia thermophila]SHJ47605.1 cAMP-binding domain of CRP or a regulatory subunit of cAMP-dependent protein kinases [Pseudozobellia thermophila]